jgi:hypothetical protein
MLATREKGHKIGRIPKQIDERMTSTEGRSAEMLEGAIVPSFQFHIAHLIYPKAASWQGVSLWIVF